MKKFIQTIKGFFAKPNVSISLWEYGTCNGTLARRHKIKKNVQMKLWKAGEQGHKEDYWHNFDSSWWDGFTPTN
jgi:hypothetical protein